MSGYLRNLLKVPARQIVGVLAHRNERGEVDEITLDSEITRDFVAVFNEEVRRAKQQRDEFRQGMKGD